jgi:general secretion pathway protein I
MTRTRSGLSLIEVLLSLTILLMSLAAIGQLVDMGSERGIEARFHVRGTRLAQAKMAEVEAGVVPADTGGQGGFEIEDDVAWSWVVESQPAGPPGLYQVTVRVTRDFRGRPFEVVLSQMIMDPGWMGTAAQAERPTETDVEEAGTGGVP